MFTEAEVATYLRKYNAWRRGGDERTMDEAWDSAWSGAQKTFHARSMQEMRMQVDRLREALDRLVRSCDNLEYEAGRVALSVSDAEDLLDELDNMENVS